MRLSDLMSFLYLWLPNEPEAPLRAVLSTMESAVRVHEEQRTSFWDLHGLGMGALVRDAEEQTRVEPVQSAGGYYLWVVGEIFDGGKLADGAGVIARQRREFRSSLLKRLAAVDLDELDSLADSPSSSPNFPSRRTAGRRPGAPG